MSIRPIVAHAFLLANDGSQATTPLANRRFGPDTMVLVSALFSSLAAALV
jgi:hypothetical protein